MPREKEGFRANLARINELVPDRECLRKKDVARITGWNIKTVDKRITWNRFGEVTKADLARQISV